MRASSSLSYSDPMNAMTSGARWVHDDHGIPQLAKRMPNSVRLGPAIAAIFRLSASHSTVPS